MTGSRLMHWILCCLVAAVGVAGCTTDTTSPEASGSLNLNLELAPGVVINEVDYEISGNGIEAIGGAINTSAPGATASVEVFGLPPGEDYLVEMEATSEDREITCRGSAEFDVTIGVSTDVMVMLNCKLPARFGGVRVNGKFNICAELHQVVVSPLQTSVGNDIDLSAEGMDVEDDDIKYLWSNAGGTIGDPNAASTTYTCTEAGEHQITITISDDDFEFCMDDWTVPVTCVGDDGGTGGSGGAGGMAGAGGAGGEGGAGGAGGAPECVVDAQCDLGEICVDDVCRSDPDLFCDTRLCAEDAGLRADCVEAFLLCLAENPNEEECVALSLLICNECNDDQGCDEGFVCDDNNECVVPLECIDDAGCAEDGNPCTAAACENNTCGQVPTNEGGSCDSGTGSGDGSCNAGTCDSNDECTVDGQCSDDDGNECTVPVCVQTGAPYFCDEDSAPADGNECDGGAGTCQAGVCEPTGPPTFDLSLSVVKPYNSLLDVNTGTGNFLTDCGAPDLSGNPGASLTGISTKCIIITPPDISGFMEFDETSPGNFDVTGEQTLSFVIDVTIAAVSAQVIINTNSVTSFSGTGTGALPGTITLDALTAPFNINAAATGNVNCQALNTMTMMDVSCAICPLANLTCGDNSVPLVGDPGMRTFPPINIASGVLELGAGPADATGWYLSNPAALAGNGTQWVALSGVQQ